VDDYRERAIDGLLTHLLGALPAFMLVGPRATGKTTTAIRHAATIVRLDRRAEAEAFQADPDAALRGLEEPVLLDEWQMAPDVLGAVKRAVDSDPRPGRYLLTGSVRAELDSPMWPGTGRVIRIPMYGMTLREQLGRLPAVPLIDRLVAGLELSAPPDPPDLRGYVEMALASGFPEAALASSERARSRWLESYVEQVVSRDVEQIEPGRDPTRLRRYLESYAVSSAGVVEEKKLIEAAGINRKTAIAYERLLSSLFVVEDLPGWTSNRLKRLVRSRKRYLVDAALVSSSLGIGIEGVMRDGDILGRLLDTFVVSQIRSELPLGDVRPRLYHLRTEGGRHEIDIVAEMGAGDIAALEVKAHSAPGKESARHIAWLRDQLGDRFVGGVVLHTGPRVYRLDEGIIAAPICALWG
jgi:hypothetical protein